MNVVKPIKDLKQVEKMKQYLKERDVQDYTMFVLGINVALRISDLLSLRWSDVLYNDKETFKDIKIQEEKTGKHREIELNQSSKSVLREYMDQLDEINLNDFIFVTREKNNKPITESKFLSVLNRILTSKQIGLTKVDSYTIKEIKDNVKLFDIQEKLKSKDSIYLSIFMLVLHSDMQLPEIIRLKVEEVKKLDSNLCGFVEKLLKGLKDDDYIFRAFKGNTKPITRHTALSTLKNAAKAVGIKEEIGTHSLRKTWGWHAWQGKYDPVLIMETLNHSSLKVTKIYLGITQSEINDLYRSINL